MLRLIFMVNMGSYARNIRNICVEQSMLLQIQFSRQVSYGERFLINAMQFYFELNANLICD